jgi:hypothetical protein
VTATNATATNATATNATATNATATNVTATNATATNANCYVRAVGPAINSLYSKDLSTLPALPTTQLGRLDYLSNMGLFWKMWIWSTGLQEKEDLSLPV